MLEKNLIWEHIFHHRMAKKSRAVFAFCKDCRKNIDASEYTVPIDERDYMSEPCLVWDRYNRLTIKSFKCPHCGQEITKNNTERIKDQSYIHSYKVHVDGRKIRYTSTLVTYNINRWSGLADPQIEKFGIVFDTMKGFTYFLPIITVNGKKKKQTGRICNGSYGNLTPFLHRYLSNYDSIMAPGTINQILDLIREKYREDGFEIPDYKDLSLEKLVLINRLPGVDPGTIIPYPKFFGKKGNPVYRVVKNTDWAKQKDIFTLFDVRPEHMKRNFIKEVSQNPTIIASYDLFREIKSYDLMYRCLDWMNNLEDEYHNDHNYMEFKKFFDALIKSNKEQYAVQKLMAADIYILSDTCSMYRKLRRFTRKIDLTGTIQEIHDRIAREIYRFRSVNKPIKYDRDDLTLNDKVSGYEFTLAENTDELKLAGNLLDICVGSYDERALSKQCRIIFVKQADQYIACIELDGKTNSLRQAKLRFNRIPEGEVLSAIMFWVNKHHLTIDTYDLRNENQLVA